RPVYSHLVITEISSAGSVRFSKPYRPDATRIMFCFIAPRTIYENIIPVTVIVDDGGIIDDGGIAAPVDIVIVNISRSDIASGGKAPVVGWRIVTAKTYADIYTRPYRRPAIIISTGSPGYPGW